MSDWIDGPKLVEWLERTGILTSPNDQVGRDDESLIRRWKHGRAASVYTVDRILCKLGVCLGELPADFYRERPEKGYRAALDATTTKRIQRLYRQGKNFAEIGRTVGCTEKTAARHVRKAIAV